MSNIGGPLTLSQLQEVKQNFLLTHANLNNYQVADLFANVQDFIAVTGLDGSWQGNTSRGLMCKYMLLEPAPGQKQYAFAMVNAEKDPAGGYRELPGSTWFSFSAGGQLTPYTTPQELAAMQAMIQDYNNVWVCRPDQVNTPQQTTIGALPQYPKTVYFTCSTIYQWLVDNDALVAPAPALKIHLTTGAQYLDISGSPLDQSYKCATAVFWLDNAGVPYLSDVYNEFNLLFDDKALGMGTHCPPTC